MRAGVALGSNLGDRLRNLQAARTAILSLPDVGPPFLSSGIFATAPVDCAPGAGEFFNAVIEMDYSGNVQHLMKAFRQIEAMLGRPSRHPRNENRTIDIDLLYAGEMEIHDKHLQIPHPRMTQRAFVMQPLAQIRADLILPGQTASISRIQASLETAETVRLLTNEW